MLTCSRDDAAAKLSNHCTAAWIAGKDQLSDVVLRTTWPGNEGSHIQHQPLSGATAAADHDLLVGRLLFFAEHRIVVDRDAGDDAGLAGTADAELAGIV